YNKMYISSTLFISLFIVGLCLTQTQAQGPASQVLALTGDPTQMRVSWYSLKKPKAPVVQYSLEAFEPSSSLQDNLAIASIEQYTEETWKGYSVTGVMDQLTPMTTYYYSVGDKATNLWSDLANFTTSPSFSNDTLVPYTFAIFGDMGVCTEEVQTVNNIVSRMDQLAFAVHIGDIAYADLNGLEPLVLGNQTVWNIFLEQIRPISSHIPYMTAIGNHDILNLESGIYRKTFNMPNSNQGVDTWYSYDYMGVHFVVVSTEHTYLANSTQHAWLENELRTYRAANPDGWLIMYAHRPVYCSAHFPWCEEDPMRYIYIDSVEYLYQQYNVDVYISGHSHVYERTLPVYKGEVRGTYDAPLAPVHLVVGTGGNQEGILHRWQDQPVWSSGVRLLEAGFGLMSVINSTNLHWQFIDDATNTVTDDIILTKGYFN
ncbi:hypothetical protein SAMD00019534_103860, partial [Acytostelium subglobosum LB1]|uniref:hypothetical protein n=1 Tax=Acytostelium subglobosum LB1 TaxID=1410327 RepID=UPI0006447C4D